MPKCDYGCGKEGILYARKTKRWRCCRDSRNCPGNKMKFYNKVLQICYKLNGECLSSFSDYTNVKGKLRFKCSHGHEFSTTVSSIIYQKSWCPICGGKQKHTIAMLKEKAKEFNGKCLSKKYIDHKHEYLWKCENNHIFKKTWDSVNNHDLWCPECKPQYKMEEICRFILNEMTGEKFIKTRKVIDGFELDGFCEKLNICFEYHGKQHFFENKFFHQKEGAFLRQKERDKRLEEKCSNLGISLITIPYTLSYEEGELELHIRENLIGLGIKIVKEPNLSELTFHKSKIEEVKTKYKKKKIEVVSFSYKDYILSFDMKCSKGHTWNCGTEYIRRNMGCPFCSNHRRSKDNCLATKYPEVAKQWHPTKNGNLSPLNIAPYSRKKAWWIDENGNESKTVIKNKVQNYRMYHGDKSKIK